MRTFYQILNLPSLATHEDVKHAFRKQAMALHPDRNPDRPDAEELFKHVVEAYETLSDVHKRAAYDVRVLGIRPVAFDRGLRPEDLVRAATDSVLDSPADDTLEEYVVGNEPPPDSTLRTLFRDLERTENFILLRDGKEAYFTKQFVRAHAIFASAETRNPCNILVLYYLGRSCEALGQLPAAEKLLRRALKLGESRTPPNHCPGVRRALLCLYRRRGKTLCARWLELENKELSSMEMDDAEAMARSVGRAMARIEAERAARSAAGEQKQIRA